ncbi:hypothetical protein L1049_026619 [Liquidambar formosana]|uniref:Uncharacterized protein n=1 Tax=Liquidambar formosana TaxID=63359 RepID=A0AAP0NDN1_LIQFO
MGHMSCNDRMTCRRWHPSGGFRLRTRRNRLHIRFVHFISLLCRWKYLYEKAILLLKKGITRRSNKCSDSHYNNNSNLKRRRVLEAGGSIGGSTSYGPSSPFYSEAISECLEFIRREFGFAALEPLQIQDPPRRESDGGGGVKKEIQIAMVQIWFCSMLLDDGNIWVFFVLAETWEGKNAKRKPTEPAIAEAFAIEP